MTVVVTSFKINSAESPPSKNLDRFRSGFFYGKCRSMASQLCISGVLPLNGFGWLNVLMSIGNGGKPKHANYNISFSSNHFLTLSCSAWYLASKSLNICWNSGSSLILLESFNVLFLFSFEAQQNVNHLE